MKLFFQKTGEGPALIILHGLYGSSDNWITIARQLSKNYGVYLIDLRNHGKSPHDKIHSYLAMCDDLYEFMLDQHIEKSIILGHSMGGKTAMLFTAMHSEKVSGLIVVDIAPAGYTRLVELSPLALEHLNIAHAMLEMDFSLHKSRTEIENSLKNSIQNDTIRQFLMKNVHREKDGSYKWKLNIKAISDALPEILGPLDLKKYLKEKTVDIPSLFIRGGKSNYLLPGHYPEIKQFFPAAKIETIPNAGHWVHAEQPETFLKTVEMFLNQIKLVPD